MAGGVDAVHGETGGWTMTVSTFVVDAVSGILAAGFVVTMLAYVAKTADGEGRK